MSLLLDALSKKSGVGNKQPPGQENPTELTLEELPAKRTAGGNSDTPPVTHEAPGTSPRSAGENLFAAKKTPSRPKFQYNLGIVPTAIIIGLILGTAGSIYVWYEIQPPKQGQYRPAPMSSVTPPPPPATITRTPPPPLALSNEPPPIAESRVETSKMAPITQPAKTTPKIRQHRPAPAPAETVQIQRRTDTDDTYSILLSAYQDYEKGNLEPAQKKYATVLNREPRNRDALLGMAAIAQQQKQDDRAKQYYGRVLNLDPRDPVALAGMTAFSSTDTATRESKLKYNLSQSPNSPALHFALGNLYMEQSRWSEAQESFFNALRLEPANAQFAFSMAICLDHLGQAKLAAQYYRQALQLDTSGNAGFDRAQTEKRLNQLSAN